jgi:hypothetical protein
MSGMEKRENLNSGLLTVEQVGLIIIHENKKAPTIFKAQQAHFIAMLRPHFIL